ncbi:MAG: hypothetical protein JXR70_14380 [Spirochaetales bacterium]|nr:hypothetical protein [Spirochaetales bacterium]
MSHIKIIFFISLSLASAALIAASIKFDSLVLLFFIILFSFLQAIFRKSAGSLFLIISILLSTAGFYYKADALFLFVYLTFSLVCWDLSILEKLLTNPQEGTRRFIFLRVGFLFTLSFTSFLVIIFIRFIHFDIPFYALLLIAIIILLGLFKIIGFFISSSK